MSARALIFYQFFALVFSIFFELLWIPYPRFSCQSYWVPHAAWISLNFEYASVSSSIRLPGWKTPSTIASCRNLAADDPSHDFRKYDINECADLPQRPPVNQLIGTLSVAATD